VHVIALSPEPVEVIARYTERYGIEFPIVSDADSAVIRQYGILNTGVPEDNVRYGMPFPGAYLTDAEGRITQKHFNTNFRVRETAEGIIRGDLGAWFDLAGYPAASGGATVSATLGGHDLKPFQHVDLLVRIELPEGQHAYGEPVPDGYIPTSVTVTGPEELRVEQPILPPTRPLLVADVNAELPIFEGDLEIRVPLSYRNLEATPGDPVPIEIEVRYQACDEEVCYLPAHERLTLDATAGANLRPVRD
jgi:hypothetical protein